MHLMLKCCDTKIDKVLVFWGPIFVLAILSEILFIFLCVELIVEFWTFVTGNVLNFLSLLSFSIFVSSLKFWFFNITRYVSYKIFAFYVLCVFCGINCGFILHSVFMLNQGEPKIFVLCYSGMAG